jgi:hypothetical protein
VEEFLKTYLKNKCSYARKRGYLTEKTNQRQDRHEEEQEQEEKRKSKGKDREIEEDDDSDSDLYGSDHEMQV